MLTKDQKIAVINQAQTYMDIVGMTPRRAVVRALDALQHDVTVPISTIMELAREVKCISTL